jgi:threonine dehydrogenase-like Zn-dependent dehydrogenase
MKSVKITGENACEVVEVADPKVRGHYAKIKIHSAPLCTESGLYEAGLQVRDLGHEAAGEVVEVGEKSRVKIGERVAVMPAHSCGQCYLCMKGDYMHCTSSVDPLEICHSETGTSTLAEYCIQQDRLLLPIPDDMSYDHAAMACCALGPSFKATKLMQVSSYDTVLVAGLGAIGLGACINALYRGARVLALETRPFRAELAKKVGVEEVIDPRSDTAMDQILELTHGKGADKVIETTDNPDSPPFLVKAVRGRGEITFISWSGEIPVRGIVGKGLHVHGAWHWNHVADAPEMLGLIRNSKSQLDAYITHKFPLSQIKQAWDLKLSKQCGKVIIHPQE